MRSIAIAYGMWIFALPVFAQQRTVDAPTLAPVRIAFVDFQRVAAESAEGKASALKLQALIQRKTAELQEKTKALESAQQKFQESGRLNQAARTQAQKDVDRLNVEIERLKQDASKEIQDVQQQLFGDLQKKVRPILDAMIKEKAIQVVFNAGEVATFLVDPTLEITQDLIKRFDSVTGMPAAPATTGVKPAVGAKDPSSVAKPTKP
jgi:Skp family chaperone for outer membrane proteins